VIFFKKMPTQTMRVPICSLSLIALLLLSAPPATPQSTATFTSTGNMHVPRYGHSSTLLPDGRVLIAGGVEQCSIGCTGGATAELYDPSTGVFSPTGNMTAPRSGHFAVLLPDGTVYIVGGAIPGNGTVPDLVSAEIYDPTSGTFSAAGNLPLGPDLSSVTLLANGSLLMLESDLSVVVDPDTGSFGFGGQRYTTGKRVAVLLPDGNVVAFPADNGPQTFTVETWSAATNAFTDAPWPFASNTTDQDGDPIATGSTVSHATLLPNGKVLLVLQPVANPPLASTAPTNAQTMLYDPSNGSFQSLINPFEDEYNTYTMRTTLLSDGGLLVTGGSGSDGNVVQQTEIYNAASGTFAASALLPQPWSGYRATLLNNGDVLVTGGVLMNPTGVTPDVGVTSAEIYHPATSLPAPVLAATNAQGQGAIWNPTTGAIASSANPATAGAILSMYTTNLIVGGAIPPQVSVGGRFGQVTFFGSAPGYPGYFQVNFMVPDGVNAGANVPVRLGYLGRWSNSVTIAVE
jgi:hypothetical protein